MNLYIIEKEQELVGKTIKATNLQFHGDKGYQFIGTNDGGLYMQEATFEDTLGSEDNELEMKFVTIFKGRILHLIANDMIFKRNLIYAMKLSENEVNQLAADEIAKAEQAHRVEREEYRKRRYEDAKKLVAEYELEILNIKE